DCLLSSLVLFTLTTMDAPLGEESSSGAVAPGSAPSPQSEAVTNELQELSLQPTSNLLPLQERKNVKTGIMLDTSPGLHIDSAPLRTPPISDGLDKRGVRLDYERHACHSLREVLQLKLQQRRTREELVSQGIMPLVTKLLRPPGQSVLDINLLEADGVCLDQVLCLENRVALNEEALLWTLWAAVTPPCCKFRGSDLSGLLDTGGRPEVIDVFGSVDPKRAAKSEKLNKSRFALKTPAAFHEQRKSLERARTEDYLKRKIRNRPERSELVRMHILEETSAEPALQARQLQLKRARLADDLNDKISQRPGPMELIHKNILPIHSSLKQALLELPKGTGENSSFDEDSSDALSPDQPTNQDSPLGSAPVPSPPDTLGKSSDPSPTQAPPPPPLPLAPVPSVPQKLTNGTAAVAVTKTTPSLLKNRMQGKATICLKLCDISECVPLYLVQLSQSKISSDRSTQRSKKPKDSKPKVKKLKYHQYIPPDQKTEREPPPQLDSSYAKILHQQQLFLQLQIINQQQQHYNYHTILPAPPKPPADQQSSSTTGPSPSRGGSTSTLAASSQNGPNRQIHPPVPLPILGPLPSNLDDFKVAELKHELKIRGLPVSGTKNDLLERLRNFQEQNAGAVTAGATPKSSPPLQLAQPVGPPHVLGGTTLLHKPGEGGVVVAAFPFVATVGGGGAQTAAPSAVVQFSSTGSSPPISPTPSERSFAGMSADEASCNGDLFGEAVSSSLTQLSLYPSPQQHSVVKEETTGLTPSCRFSQRALQSTDTLDKDQMLQEKDKQIEELMRMLRQKQRLVETLRSQLEQGKREGLDVPEVLSVKVKEEPLESAGESSCCSYSPISPDLAEKEAIKVIIKEETEEEPEEMVPELIHFEHSVSPVFITQQQSTSAPASSFSLDLLKAQPTPALLTDSNGNHFLVALSSHSEEVQDSATPQGRATRNVKLQRAQSTPSKALSRSPPQQASSDPQSMPRLPQGSTLPKKDNGSNQHMDDLFDILIQSGEISANFKADPEASGLRPNTPLPSPSDSPLHFSPPAAPEPVPSQQPSGSDSQLPDSAEQEVSSTGSGRLEDFLESTTGKPLLGVEPGAPVTLIDDLHSQMLSTSSILDHPPSPMDTCELTFTSQPPVLDFGDPALDGMEWLDITMGNGGSGLPAMPMGSSHTTTSVFSTDFLDGSDLHLHWDSCL
ncbi:MKL/myocardin-like protein 1-like, partial [Scleropages formosus]